MTKNNKKIIKIIMLLGILISASNANAFTDPTCSSLYANMMSQALYFKRQGLPIGNAYGIIEDVAKNDYDAYSFLRKSIADIYSDPNRMQKELSNGTWVKKCTKISMDKILGGLE